MTNSIMTLLYQLGIRLYGAMISLVGWVNPKAKAWIQGRKIHRTPNLSEKDRVWIHCASLGEYEQALPIIHLLKSQYPHFEILLSFFSPSGFDFVKKSSIVDHKVYLPLDTKQNVRHFIAMIKPTLAIFIKYEFWYNYLHSLNVRQIPTFVIAATFRPQHFIFKPYGRFISQELKKITGILVQDQASKTILDTHGFLNTQVCGDTRVDQVKLIQQTEIKMDLLLQVKGDRNCFIAGSTHPEDEKHLRRWRDHFPDDLLIIAPHHLDSAVLKDTVSRFGPQAALYSAINPHQTDVRTIVIDRMGLLKYLYRIADIAYVGGGFGAGIHNILEPAIYGIPVIMGPRYHKFIEAGELLSKGICASIQNSKQLNQLYIYLSDPSIKQRIKQKSIAYFDNLPDSTTQIINTIKKYLT